MYILIYNIIVLFMRVGMKGLKIWNESENVYFDTPFYSL